MVKNKNKMGNYFLDICAKRKHTKMVPMFVKNGKV